MFEDIYKKKEFLIKRKSNEIWFNGLLSNQYIGVLGERELKGLIFSEEQILVFINSERDSLSYIEKQEVRGNWEEDYKDHIAENDYLIRVDDYPRGCCYVSTLWKMKYGTKIILMYYYH